MMEVGLLTPGGNEPFPSEIGRLLNDQPTLNTAPFGRKGAGGYTESIVSHICCYFQETPGLISEVDWRETPLLDRTGRSYYASVDGNTDLLALFDSTPGFRWCPAVEVGANCLRRGRIRTIFLATPYSRKMHELSTEGCTRKGLSVEAKRFLAKDYDVDSVYILRDTAIFALTMDWSFARYESVLEFDLMLVRRTGSNTLNAIERRHKLAFQYRCHSPT